MSIIRFERTGSVGHIVQCDPPENQLGRRWADELRRAVHEASGSGVRALVVRSEGPNFGTGGTSPSGPARTCTGSTPSSTR